MKKRETAKMHLPNRKTFAAVIFCLVIGVFALAVWTRPSGAQQSLDRSPGLRENANGGAIAGERLRGAKAATETVAELMARETRKTAFSDFENPRAGRRTADAVLPGKQRFFGATQAARFPFAPFAEHDRFPAGELWSPIAGTSIAGPGRTADALTANHADSAGDVGPTQVLLHANGRVKVYDKLTGAAGGLDVDAAVFWESVRDGRGVADARVEYDHLSGRWFLSAVNTADTLNRILIAVSSGPTISGASSFTFYQITSATEFFDNPTLGVDAHAVYIGGNVFLSSTGAFSSTRGYVVNKAALLAGSLNATLFNDLATGSTPGPWCPQGVSSSDSSLGEGYFIGVDVLNFDQLQIRRVTNPGGVPTLSGNLTVAVPATVFPLAQEHRGRIAAGAVTRFLDALDDRLFQAQIARNNISGATTLWTAHNISVDSSGVATTGFEGRNGSRWYEIGNLTTTPALVQSGTLYDGAETDPNGFWMPSVAMSGQGHMAIGANSAGVNRFAEIWTAGRLRGDDPGTTGAPARAQSSAAAYNLETAGTQRWGDYSKTTVDPCDNQSLWHIGQYADAENSWRMRAIKLIAPPPPAATASPASIGYGLSNVNVVVTGVSVGGSEFYDNPAGYACNAGCGATGTGNCRMTATASGPSSGTALSINSVTFNSPTQVTLNVSTNGAMGGTHTLQIRNPDGQATSFNIEVLVPTAATVPLGGRVRSSTGAPLAGVTVSVLDTENGEAATLVTDERGRYLKTDAAAGRNYVVTPSKAGYAFEPASRIVALAEENLGVDFVAAASAARRGAFNDFDGDGRTDLSVFRPAEGNWYIWQSATETMRVENWGVATDLLTPADYDGDGKTDLAVFRPSNGVWYVRRSSDQMIVARQFGQSGDEPAAGDYDGDGRADFAVFRAKEGRWYILQSSNEFVREVSWGARGDRPAPADFDGDGRLDPTVYRPADGRWYSLYSSNGAPSIAEFGLSGDRPAPADFDGDGKADRAVYRPGDGLWFVLRSSNAAVSIDRFGLPDDTPLAGDFDGDGRADLGIYRASNAIWYTLRSSDGFAAQKWGTNGDVPAVPDQMK